MKLFVNSFLQSKYFLYCFPFFVMIFVFLTNSPSLKFVLSNELNLIGWDVVKYKSNHLLSNLDHVIQASHFSKTVFRLTVPLIVRIFQLNFPSLIVLQFLLYYFFIFFLAKYFIRELNHYFLSLLLVFGLCTTYFGKALIVDFRWFDGWAYFFMVLSLYSKNKYVLFVSVLLGMFTDERFILAIPAIFLLRQDSLRLTSIRALKFTSKYSLTILIGVVVSIFIRFILIVFFNMHLNSVGIFTPLVDNVLNRLIGIGYFTFFEGFWIFVFYFLFYAKLSFKKNILTVLILLVFFVGTSTVFLLYDLTRAGAYFMPYVFLFIVYLSNTIKKEIFKHIVFTSVIISFLFPPNYVVNGIGINNFIINDYFYIVLKKIFVVFNI
jgi:hypothetical protein